MSLVPFVGVIGLGIATVLQLVQHGDTGFLRATLLNCITYLVGVTGIMTGCGHLFFPDPIADSIGWTRGSPFQWEVGLADLSYGVLGVTASSYGRGFWLATIIAFSVFMLGAAAGHVRQMVQERNFSPGNVGVTFVYDIAAPVLLIALYLAY